MIYTTAPARAPGTWGLTIRLFLLALQDTGLPIRLLWRDKVTVQEGDFEPELDGIRRMASAPPLGPPVEPCHGVVRIGEVQDILTDVQAERALYEIALTDWPTDRVPPRIARRLQKLDEVWCWTVEGAEALRAAGVDALHVPVPVDVAACHAAVPLASRKEGETLYYSVGSWGSWDNVQAATVAFCRAFGPTDPARLLLACDDAPADLRGVLVEASERPSEALPRISLVRHVGGSLASLRRLHATGQVYLEASHRVGRSLHGVFAAAGGSEVVEERTRVPIPEHLSGGLYRDPQEWCETDPVALARRIRAGWDGLRPAVGGWETVVEQLRGRLEAVKEPVGLLGPGAVKASSRPPEPLLSVIIPHRDSPVEWVEDVVARAKPQLRMLDELIISTQTDDEVVLLALEALSGEYGATLVVDETPGPVWSIARARNGGLWACETGTYVLTLDCDIAVPEDYLDLVRAWLAEHPEKGIAPEVVQLERYMSRDETLPTGGAPKRNGTGLSVLPRAYVLELGGWDEGYVGYGSEDIDLLWRLRKIKGYEAEPVEGIRVFHQPHAEAADKALHGPRNMARLNNKLADGFGEVENDREGFRFIGGRKL